MADHYIQSDDPAIKAMLLGEIPPPKEERQLSHTILGYPLRGYFMAGKTVFLKAVVAYGKLFPQPTKKNTEDPITYALIEVFEKLLEYNVEARQDFLEAVAKIFPVESSHDRWYKDRMQVILEGIILKILEGKWPARGADCPEPKFWKEPKPYGGKQSIVYRLALYGEEIMEMIRRPKDESDEPYNVPDGWNQKGAGSGEAETRLVQEGNCPSL